ncbi:hypothetical protein BDY24DRAFT_323361, partial [Mrakia frigida]|uniref:uncharacterized protein n=1 Tax=Mrakia frigida TaxID=29902 RepID=UPI003FCC0800
VKKAILNSCRGNINRWPFLVSLAVWADRVTTKRTTGFSPYRLVFGVEPTLPLDWIEGTFLVRGWEKVKTTEELLALRMRQLEKKKEDQELAAVRLRVARTRSVDDRNSKFHRVHSQLLKNPILDGELVLIRNSSLDFQHSRKEEDIYLGPYRVIKRSEKGAFVLEELDGTPLRSAVAAVRIRRYY